MSGARFQPPKRSNPPSETKRANIKYRWNPTFLAEISLGYRQEIAAAADRFAPVFESRFTRFKNLYSQ